MGLRSVLQRTATAVALVMLAHGSASASEISGIPRIVSGESVVIGKTRVRLAALAAPSPEQLCLDAAGARWSCGLSARDELAGHVDKKPWSCQALRTDSYGRTVAKCSVDGEDIGKWLVRSGWAVAVTRFGHDYAADETAARANKAGLWAGAFIAPPEWRRRNKQAPVLGSVDVAPASRITLMRGRSASSPPSPDCAIKGHVNRSGTCIYHMPGGRWYARISMVPENGDRWFCSREEAELASCRETRR